MSDDRSGYKHNSSDKQLDKDATEASGAAEASHPHPGHNPEKIKQHDDDGKDRLFEGRIQHDDADKESNRNRQEKDIARHHHNADEVMPISDTDTHPKK